jgi:hypothetical protein
MSTLPKSRREGYLMVDHRASPGVSHNRPGGQLLEAATITCKHCQAQIIRNPMRTRERAWCPKCDSYICDRCEAIRVAAGGECKTFAQVMDEFEKQIRKQEALHG